jgi:hypothetical protein
MTKELTAYKTRYAKAVKRETKTKIVNCAFLNLGTSDFKDFLRFQIDCDNESL